MNIETETRLRDLAGRLVGPGPKAEHVSASECHELSEGLLDLLDEKRSAEAEELRRGIETIMSDPPCGDDLSNEEWKRPLQRLLDEVCARDSLAHLEARDEKHLKVLADLQGAHGEIESIRAEQVDLRAQLRREQDARANLRVEIDRVKGERDDARAELVKALQTLELNMPALEVPAPATHCACCGRKRGDGRRDRGWTYLLVDVSRARRYCARVAFCAACITKLDAAAMRNVVKEQIEQPGEVGRG